MRTDILDVAREVVLERGVDGFTVDEVAARSGVAKTTIYRHWASAHELLVDSLRGLVDTFPTPNTGSLRGDLLDHFRHGIALLARPGMRSVMLGMMQAAEGDPDIHTLKEKLTEERHHPLTIILQLAIGRGELSSDLDLDLAEDLLHGPIMTRVLLRGETLDDRQLEQLVDLQIAALRSGAAVPHSH